ncbi:hypothetical protein ACLOJK_020830 [Asimina triloba]
MPMRGRRTREREDEKRMRMALLRCRGVGERKSKGNPSRTNGRETEWAVAATSRGKADWKRKPACDEDDGLLGGKARLRRRQWHHLEGRPTCDEDGDAAWRGCLLAIKTTTPPCYLRRWIYQQRKGTAKEGMPDVRRKSGKDGNEIGKDGVAVLPTMP